MAYTLPDDYQVDLQIGYTDAKGHPATIDGEVAWSSSDETICAVHVNPTDSTKVTLRPQANLGNCQISATADADLGSGVQNIITLFDTTVVGGSAVAGTVTPGEAYKPEVQPIKKSK
jgi:hypothetical protein